MFVLQTCSEMEKVWWNSSVERTWSTRYADWIEPSSVHIKVRLHTSASMRREALPAGVGHVPAPDPEVAIHLPTITEDPPLRAISRLHATLCRAIVHPPGGTPHSTIAHHHVIIGRKAHHLQRNWGKCFLILPAFFFKPRVSSQETPLFLATYIPWSGSRAPPLSLNIVFQTPICVM